MNTLKFTFAGIAYQRKAGMGIQMDSVYRTGFRTSSAAITPVFVQPDPMVPRKRIGRTGRNTFMIFTGQANADHRRLRPVDLDADARSLRGIFSKMPPAANLHADLAFRTSGTSDFDHHFTTFLV
ncbi:MAG: hypothetical protein NT047_08725 [Deltaproteobacteria bacterium]|nr:hypothetical protein [Deltaproteobacteria bacterium]